MIRILLAAALVPIFGAPALAHVGTGLEFSLVQGLVHPLSGFDHLAAAMAVGLWAARATPARPWLWPATFVSAMVTGALLARAGAPTPFLEPAILGSLVVLGAALALAANLNAALGAGIVALFALAHGAAHGAEAPAASFAGYVVGFALTTAVVHLAGLGVGLACRRTGRGQTVLRVAGAGLCGAGLWFLAA